MCNNDNKKFMSDAIAIASYSRDPSTKVGSIIVDGLNKIISRAYNDLPVGADSSIKSRFNKNIKLYYLEHAERSAIYFCANNGISTKNTTMYVTLYPCIDCARAIIQSGIKRVVCTKPNFSDEKWGESWRIAEELFNECGIEVEYINQS